MNPQLDITMTAVRRPGVLLRTLSSFQQNLFDSWGRELITAYVNIDPVGGTEEEEDECVFYLEHVFPRLKYNVAKEPSFPKAFIWAWEQTTADIVLHLEDDWLLAEPVDVGEVFRLFGDYPDLAILRLPAFPSREGVMKNWNKFFHFNGKYFECPKDLRREVGFCGHPSFIRGEFVREAVKHLDPTRNPEKQFHHGHPELMKLIDRWQYGVLGKPTNPPYIHDTGRKWLIETNWRKKGNKAHFTEWEQV